MSRLCRRCTIPRIKALNVYFNLIVRTTQDEKTLLPTLVSTIHQFDRGIGTSEESTMMHEYQ